MSVDAQLITYFNETYGVEVGLETLLIEEGIIDSMGVAELVEYMEEHYQLDIDLDDMTIDNFATISSLVNLINKRRSAA